ncbi:MAG: hypothetical protein KTR23_13290 [Rhodospirillales bacterium]|nr:hypothetical protein [Rhodospirillales bacterium]
MVTSNTSQPSTGNEKVIPSQFMRQRRPDCYSDTEDRTAYLLDAPTLEYHLETLTNRNQENDFEVFCRKLCERTICPNLRAHTGPDGGGDSKVDTETYPVSENVATLFYIGAPAASQERWAFAFSAKEKWDQKVKDDVKSIDGTGRGYKKIVFVTSQFARDKKRAQMEDSLSKEYGIPVTIHDRSWIIQEVIEHDRKDIAFNYLSIGEEKSNPLRLGPEDYSRAQQLADIEKAFDSPEAFDGMETQRVTEALVAAKLSRNMEKPRAETEGRFDRAVRLAEADGTYRQKLETKYEYIWTEFWWFDDFHFLKSSYQAFEALALRSEHSMNLELLSNILQLLVNSVVHKHLTADECKLSERTARLKQALEKIAADTGSPNNALEARTLLLMLSMNQIPLLNQPERFPEIWQEMSAVLDEAKGLGEFRADKLVRLIQEMGDIVGNDPDYNVLIEKTARFITERKGEAEGALVLLKRAQKLDFNSNLDMIRFLGKAAIGLSKKEYAESLTEALQLLMLAYRSTGLLWASRASCMFLSATLVIEGEENSEIPISIVPTMKVWAWVALGLRHIPDFLFAIQLLNGAIESLPLSVETKKKFENDLQDLDAALGCLILNSEEAEIRKLETLPDILEALGLLIARAALLYCMGYLDDLRVEGFPPGNKTDEEVHHFFSMLASQPGANRLTGELILNADVSEIFSTKIIGMTVEARTSGSVNSILVAETILGSLEAFFATAIDHSVGSHTEKFRLVILDGEEVVPSFAVDEIDMSATVYWPAGLSPANFEDRRENQEFWIEVCSQILATCCFIQNVEDFLESLFANEAVLHRMTMIASATTSYHRVAAKHVSRLSDWQKVQKNAYELRPNRPSVQPIPLDDPKNSQEKDATFTEKSPLPKDHQAYNVHSVIDVHAWNSANWRGVAYADYGPQHPPCMAFNFANEASGQKIFERWNERIGKQDENEEIYVSIIRDLPRKSRHHYGVVISRKLPKEDLPELKQVNMTVSRSMIMEPRNSNNLERFLSSYQRIGAFYLLPAFGGDNGTPTLATELAIVKRELTIKSAKDIVEGDIEYVSLQSHL